MNLRKTLTGAAIAGVLGLPALGLGIGIGSASADPGPPCGIYCQGQQDHRGNGGDPGNGGDNGFRPDGGNGGDGGFRPDGGDRGNGGDGRFDQLRWDQRGIDQGRYDHQPFNYQGQRVEPYFDNDRGVFGFQFFGIFIPL
jgi:hypothetical protein